MATILGMDAKALLPGIAAHLAHMDDADQALFLNTFCQEIRSACGTLYHSEMQAYAVRKLLTPVSRDIMESLGAKDAT